MPTNIGELSLAGALATAVVVLWRKLEDKDRKIMEALRILEQSAEATERSAEALIALSSAVQKLRAGLPRRKRALKEPAN